MYQPELSDESLIQSVKGMEMGRYMGKGQDNPRRTETILVTGGAGYIGSHTVLRLVEAGYRVVVLDNLSTGHAAALPVEVELHVIELRDRQGLERILSGIHPDAVIHFAASIEAGESVVNPSVFYGNNVCGTLNLIEAMIACRVKNLVFSSTAAVYGEPVTLPIGESAPLVPVNPYGNTKLAVERMIADHHVAFGFRHVILRYFNACGAHPSGHIGEAHPRKTHLIELALLALITGRDSIIKVFGEDYPTPDGTAVRDYVHVCDLAEAHVLAVDALLSGSMDADIFNVGLGRGFSVKEVLDAVDRVTGRTLRRISAPRRPGDPATLVAATDRIGQRLGWYPRYKELDDIVGTAWNWHRNHPGDFNG